MITLLLIIIYLAFISLGLPDSILGTTWPVMRGEMGLPLDAAGFVSIVITVGSVISGLLSGKINKFLGTGKVVFFSCFMTGAALLSISFIPKFYWLVILAVPLGFGAGSVDASLNNYVALHFKAHHMNWLHSFWGLGATIGPIIVSGFLSAEGGWRTSYRVISFIQLTLAIILFITLPLWKKVNHSKKEQFNTDNTLKSRNQNKKHVLMINGVIYAMGVFLFYCGVEMSVGLWGSSYLIQIKLLKPETAAFFVALYYLGITMGRVISGFFSFKLTNKQLIKIGVIISILAMLLMFIPLGKGFIIIPMVLLGLGLSPIFPAMVHETPVHFGEQNSQTIIGYQMSAAYFGSSIIPPAVGFILNHTSLRLFPFCILFSMLVVIICYIKLKNNIKITLE
jgi:fucose permease